MNTDTHNVGVTGFVQCSILVNVRDVRFLLVSLHNVQRFDKLIGVQLKQPANNIIYMHGVEVRTAPYQ